jgi:molybdopterin-guanine dinucleotide biosynthesis protein A
MTLLQEQRKRDNCCAVILSGGLNSRMAGKNKAFLDVGGDTILNRLLATLDPLFGEILIVTRQPEIYADIPVKVVVDLFEARSSLTGIHAGLVNADADHAFVVPCDAPFVQQRVIQLLLDTLAPKWDVVIPMMDGYYQPLCAIYSKRCIPVIETQLRRGDYKIFNFFYRMKIKTLPANQIKAADPDLLSFLNINTPQAYLDCQELLRKET